MTDLAAAARAGALLGAAFNPLTSLVVSTVAAALIATGRGWKRATIAAAVLMGGWLIGDGWMVIERVRGLAERSESLVASTPAWASWVAVSIWIALGLGIGYLVPLFAGAYAGRRVTWGTGWLTAATLAAGVSAALAQIARGILG